MKIYLTAAAALLLTGGLAGWSGASEWTLPTPGEILRELRGGNLNGLVSPVPTVLAGEPADGEFHNSGDEGFKRAILRHRISLDAWIERLNTAGPALLCLGETHYTDFRHALSRDIFSKLRFDKLFLEALPGEVDEIISRVDAGEQSVNLLGADIAKVIRTARTVNPGLKFAGIEETKEQERLGRKEPWLKRDSFIAKNLLGGMIPGGRHVALYGSLHCARNDLGLGGSRPFYRHLEDSLGSENMRSVVVARSGAWANQFSVFMQILGLSGESFVIPDTSLIDPADYDYNWNLRKLFDNYTTIVYLAGEKQVDEEEPDRR